MFLFPANYNMSGKSDLDARAAAGETVVEGGTGGKSLQAQKNLAQGNSYFLKDILHALDSTHFFSSAESYSKRHA